jgi:curved DNA-binding protein CbpA
MILGGKMAASRQTHYDVLQISQTATAEQIKAAYHSLALRCHPDKLQAIPKNVDRAIRETKKSEAFSAIDIDDEDEIYDKSTHDCHNENTDEPSSIAAEFDLSEHPCTEEEASTQPTIFHHIQTAYNCLRDPGKRDEYDRSMSRIEEREERKWKASSSVNLSEMECDLCCVVDEGNSDCESTDKCAAENDADLYRVYFHPCRCGDTFQVVEEELRESIKSVKKWDNQGILTSRVWQCESCSLTIRIHIDIDIR